jgi:AAA15 family ATPase/GTPase
MITKIEINGFKSFHDFNMAFMPLTVIAGVNGSGKSNLFDALHLLSRLAETDLKTAFGEQRGNASELFTQFGQDWYADEMTFAVEMLVNKKVKDNWGGESSLKSCQKAL